MTNEPNIQHLRGARGFHFDRVAHFLGIHRGVETRRSDNITPEQRNAISHHMEKANALTDKIGDGMYLKEADQ